LCQSTDPVELLLGLVAIVVEVVRALT